MGFYNQNVHRKFKKGVRTAKPPETLENIYVRPYETIEILDLFFPSFFLWFFPFANTSEKFRGGGSSRPLGTRLGPSNPMESICAWLALKYIRKMKINTWKFDGSKQYMYTYFISKIVVSSILISLNLKCICISNRINITKRIHIKN